MRKYLLAILSAVTICAVFSSCGKSPQNPVENSSTTQVSTTANYQITEQTQTAILTSSNELSTENTEKQTFAQTTAPVSQQPITEKNNTAVTSDTTAKRNESETHVSQTELTTERELKKTGEMEFSDSAKNKYLASVAKKYGLNTKNLVAIYTVPDNNGNLVLEFDGSIDDNGKLIRTADTLIAIYSIDKDLNSKRASENTKLNEYSYGEMKVMFMSTTKYIMPKFEKELNG